MAIMSLFFAIGLLIVGLTLLALIFRLLRQPLLPVYLLAGFLLGPVFHFIPQNQLPNLESFSLIGIAFLLFTAGLELDLVMIFKNLKITLLGFIFAGLNALIFLLVFGRIPLFDFLGPEKSIVAIIFSFSSTLLAVKALAEQNKLATTLGYLSLAILLAQDLIAIFALAFVGKSEVSITNHLVGIALLLLAGFAGGYFIFPRLFHFAANSVELLFLSSLGVLFLFSMIGYVFGLSLEVGAFVGGLSLSSLVYRYEISSRMRPLRDFFVMLLFLSLGLQISPESFQTLLWPFVALLVLTIVLKPIIYTVLGFLFKLSRYLSVEEGLVSTPSSEFSLALTHNLSPASFSLAGYNFLASSFLGSYFYEYIDELSMFLVHLWDKILPLRLFKKHIQDDELKSLRDHVVIFGGHRMGGRLIKKLLELKKKVVLIDHNPDIVKQFQSRVITIYGDALEQEIREKANLKNASIVVSTVPDLKINLILIREINRLNPQSFVYITASDYDEALKLYKEGADFVILPYFLGAEQANILLENFDQAIERLAKTKEDHLNKLAEEKNT